MLFDPAVPIHTMRFGSTAKVLAKCKLQYHRISECTHVMHCLLCLFLACVVGNAGRCIKLVACPAARVQLNLLYMQVYDSCHAFTASNCCFQNAAGRLEHFA